MHSSEVEEETPRVLALIEPGFEFCFELRVAVDDALPLGGAVEGDGLHFARITGGTFDGPRLRGRVLPGGGDWWNGRGLVVRLDARYVIEAEVSEGLAAVDVVNRGTWRTSEEAFARMLAGEAVSEAELYYRTAFVFQTEHPELQWLVESQFVGYARAEDGDVVIRVFRLT